MTPDLNNRTPPPINSYDDALKWAEQVVLDCEAARASCDVPVPAMKSTSVTELRRRESAYLLRHGTALGTLVALLRCRQISEVAYNTFVERTRATLTGSVVGLGLTQ